MLLFHTVAAEIKMGPSFRWDDVKSEYVFNALLPQSAHATASRWR